MREPEDFDLRVNEKWNTLEEYDPDLGTWEFYQQLGDMDAIDRAGSVIDATAILGTPELVYRKALPGEDARGKSERLRTEARQNARNALVAALGRREDLRRVLHDVLYGYGFSPYDGKGAVDFWDDEINVDMVVDAVTDYFLRETSA